MANAPPTFDDLLISYRRALIARIQQREFVGWGPTVEDGLRQTVALHDALEENFIAAEIRRRAEEDKQKGT